MCNRVVQDGRVIKPGERLRVKMRGPGGTYELDFEGAVFGGPARAESRAYWERREGAEDVLVPDVSAFGEKSQLSGEQGWEELPAGSALQGLLLPLPEGKDYRLLKIVTQAATPDQCARLGNPRAPLLAGETPRTSEPPLPRRPASSGAQLDLL